MTLPVLAALARVRAPAVTSAQANAAPSSEPCGELVTIPTHGSTTTRYELGQSPATAGPGGRMTLVLLVGGGGHLALDDKGCPRAVQGNSLVRSFSLVTQEVKVAAGIARFIRGGRY
ncbi:MAG TPA: hypothetical protein VLG10_06405 [Methylomirabilota bacterium]|nr:hypothetical protein [Methylomirabilota bacterium]